MSLLQDERDMAARNKAAESYIEHHPHGSTSFVGPDAVAFFAATAIASAMRLYLRTGLRVNRAYTPKNMIAKAEEITGQKFTGTARAKLEAAERALSTWAATMRAALPETTEAP
jgi:hypothetical protein